MESSESFPQDSFEDEIIAFINKQKKTNTTNSTKQHLEKLTSWLKDQKNVHSPIFEIPPERLNLLLCEYFMKLKKKDGSDYETTTLDAKKGAIERHLRDNLYPISIITDKAFYRFRELLNAKKTMLKKTGLGRKGNASELIDANDDQKLIDHGQLGDHSPRALLTTIFYTFGKGFGLRGRDEHRNMRFQDVEIKTANNGKEFLLFKERNSKTMDGTKRDDYRPVRPKIFATDETEFDPIRLFKLFISKRPTEACAENSPMYLTPITDAKFQKQPDGPWYLKTAMGKNTLGCLMKEACKKSGVTGKKTNHSIRKRTIDDLFAAGVPAAKIALITGHKSTESLQHYTKTIGQKEHEDISNNLAIKSGTSTATSSTALTSTSSSLSSTSSTITISQQSEQINHDTSHLFSGNQQFHNCTFNINLVQK